MSDILIGKGHEMAQHHMEIRGIGLVDIKALFGIRSVRQQKRIEVVVSLEQWDALKTNDRRHIETVVRELSKGKVTDILAALSQAESFAPAPASGLDKVTPSADTMVSVVEPIGIACDRDATCDG